MYMNLHIIVYSKNKETKNWASDSFKLGFREAFKSGDINDMADNHR